MRRDIYITINWQGKITRGEAAAIIAVIDPESDKKWMKVYGFTNCSYQKACALALACAICLVDPCELSVTVEDAYSTVMAQKKDFYGKAHQSVWEEFAKRRDKMTSFRIQRDKNHRFRQVSIARSEKGGYKMIDCGTENKR